MENITIGDRVLFICHTGDEVLASVTSIDENRREVSLHYVSPDDAEIEADVTVSFKKVTLYDKKL